MLMAEVSTAGKPIAAILGIALTFAGLALTVRPIRSAWLAGLCWATAFELFLWAFLPPLPFVVVSAMVAFAILLFFVFVRMRRDPFRAIPNWKASHSVSEAGVALKVESAVDTLAGLRCEVVHDRSVYVAATEIQGASNQAIVVYPQDFPGAPLSSGSYVVSWWAFPKGSFSVRRVFVQEDSFEIWPTPSGTHDGG